jgi:hypothetical protein
MGTDISSLPTFLAAVATLITYIYIRRRNSFLNQLQGPKSHSFWIGEYQYIAFSPLCGVLCEQHTNSFPMVVYTILGNEGDIYYQNEVGDCEFEWLQRFGSAWRRRGCVGVRVLYYRISADSS